MVRQVVETMLAAPFDRVRVVTARGAALELRADPRLEIVENPRAEEGIASSIRCGLSGLPETVEVAAIALGDVPLVAKETVIELLKAYDETRRPIVFPEYRGRQGHPVLWDRSFFGELRNLGDRGAKAPRAESPRSRSRFPSWIRAFVSTSIHPMTMLRS
jgi:molybdenum cofactor cytidylyltransferase